MVGWRAREIKGEIVKQGGMKEVRRLDDEPGVGGGIRVFKF
jgi:hypothetical protein